MGVDEVPNFPKTYWQQLLFPFYYQPGAGVQDGLAPKAQKPDDGPSRQVPAE